MSIIAICGFQGAGKDTLADILIDNYGYTRLSFAGAVKDVASIIFSWDREMLEGRTKEARAKREIIDEWWAKRLNIPHLTPRWVLQNFGTDLFRNNFHKDIWVATVEKKILNMAENKKVVITDCRFPNEIQTIKNLGGKVIHIYRGELPIWFYDFKNGKCEPPTNLHSSEWSWIQNTEFDYIINNNSTFDNLKTHAEEFIRYKEKNINKIDDYSKISIIPNSLVVFDIDDTLINFPELDKNWWYDRFKYNFDIVKNKEEADKLTLEEWIHKVKIMTPIAINSNGFSTFADEILKQNCKIIFLTARQIKIKELTEHHLKQCDIYIDSDSIFFSENKGEELFKILNQESYKNYFDIIFVDDMLHNLNNVYNKLNNKYKLSLYHFETNIK